MKSIVFWILLLDVVPCFSQKKPNVIFILTDDMGYTDLGCYGNKFNETPHIDSLAKNGIKMMFSYSASPVCSPSRASLLTGKHPARHKITNFLNGERQDANSPVKAAEYSRGLVSSEYTLAEMFRDQNYKTAMIGKWHLGGKNDQMPWSQGFQNTKVISRNGLDYYNYGIYLDSTKKEFLDNGSYYLTDRLTDYATDFIKTTQDSFFLYLSYSAPHVITVPRGDKLGKYFLKYEKYKGKYNPNYAAMIESIDDGVGLIVKTLREKGLLDNTIIVFTSDNGGVGLPELGPKPTTVEGLRKWKGHVYEGGIRIPSIISWPRELAKNQVCNSAVINTDWFGTFSEILNVKIPEGLDTKSMLTTLKNPTQTIDHADMFWHYPHFSNQLGRPSGAYRQGPWKLVKSYETNKLELFNIDNDPAEVKNLTQKQKQIANKLNLLLENSLNELQANRVIKK